MRWYHHAMISFYYSQPFDRVKRRIPIFFRSHMFSTKNLYSFSNFAFFANTSQPTYIPLIRGKGVFLSLLGVIKWWRILFCILFPNTWMHNLTIVPTHEHVVLQICVCEGLNWKNRIWVTDGRSMEGIKCIRRFVGRVVVVVITAAGNQIPFLSVW